MAQAGGDDDAVLLDLFCAIAAGDDRAVARRLDMFPDLPRRRIVVGATRRDPDRFFLDGIAHHVYAGDTALHVAAAGPQPAIATSLLARGAEVAARNRSGAEPLHYAADGRPGATNWDPAAQVEVITMLIAAGADPNAPDKRGVAPLHRAVRTRCPRAVECLLGHGADAKRPNGSGSTPLHLAVQNTGRSDSGSDVAKEGQRRIIAILLDHGARPTDTDAKGTTVASAASSNWVRTLLAAHAP